MNLSDFKRAIFETYTDGSFYEKEIFEQWAQEQSDMGADLKTVLHEIIKNYSYKKFPSFKHYSAYGKEKSQVKSGFEDKVVANVRGLEQLIEPTKQWDAAKLYQKYSELFRRNSSDLSLQQKEFIHFWCDFGSLVGWMIEDGWDKDKIRREAEATKKALLSGESYNNLYHKYFRDRVVETKLSAKMNDDSREGMSRIDNFF